MYGIFLNSTYFFLGDFGHNSNKSKKPLNLILVFIN